MLKLNINIKSETAKELLERLPEALHGALERALVLGLNRLHGAVVESMPSGATGLLAKSVFTELKDRPEIGGIVAVHPPADVYAAPVEFGARPHFPPIAALLPWVKQKLGVRDEEEARSVAFLIARAISRRGTEGQFMFTRALETERANVELLFDAEIEAALQQLAT